MSFFSCLHILLREYLPLECHLVNLEDTGRYLRTCNEAMFCTERHGRLPIVFPLSIGFVTQRWIKNWTVILLLSISPIDRTIQPCWDCDTFNTIGRAVRIQGSLDSGLLVQSSVLMLGLCPIRGLGVACHAIACTAGETTALIAVSAFVKLCNAPFWHFLVTAKYLTSLHLLVWHLSTFWHLHPLHLTWAVEVSERLLKRARVRKLH